MTKFEAVQMTFLQQQIQDEVGQDESAIPKETRRILGQKYGLLTLPDTRQLVREILSAAQS